jgi:uncharacterized membrane protein HdeD (DUF308 family)
MMHSIARNWWVLALRGGLAILFGMLVFFWPHLGLLFMVASFAAFAFLDGVFAIGAAMSGQRQGRQWWALVFQGLLGISAAILTLIWPEVTELALLFFIGFWAIATGLFAVIAAIRLRKEIEGEWALALSGALSIVFGLAIVAFPAAGLLALAWLIGAYSIAYGILMLMVGFAMRRFLHGRARGDESIMRY